MIQRNQRNEYQRDDRRFSDPPAVESRESSQPFRMLQVEIIDPCHQCGGTGYLGLPHPYCSVCHQSWTVAVFESYYNRQIRGSWRGWRRFKKLACGHKARYLRQSDPRCKACGGTGGERTRVTLTWLSHVLERLRESRLRGPNPTRPIA